MSSENPLHIGATDKQEVTKNNGPESGPRFPVWKTLTLGVKKSVSEYEKAMEDKGIRFEGARVILENPHFFVNKSQEDLDLVIVSLAELGIEKAANYQEICSRTNMLLDLCPEEVGPALRLAYDDQPEGERLMVAMQTFQGLNTYNGADYCRVAFRLINGYGHLSLETIGHPALLWEPKDRFVFVRNNQLR